MTWRVARLDVLNLPPDRRQLVLDWVTRHGVDVDDVTPRLTVSYDGHRMRMHLSRFHRVDGHKVADHNLDVMATFPLVVDVDPQDPPPWLTEEYTDGNVRPDEPVQHLQRG